MLVSIITVCYNSAKTIQDTFQSIKSQDYPQIEYIVVDGASTDATVEIIRQNQQIISQWISEPDKGLYDAMNKGIAMAKGDIIGILNSDDVYENSRVVSEIVEAFNKHQTDCVYGDLVYVHPLNTSRVIRYWKAGAFTSKAFYFGWMPPHPTFFLTRKTFESCGFFDTRFESAADYEFMLRVLVKCHKKAIYIPQILVRMRIGGLSNMSLKHRKISFHEDLRAWRVNSLKPYFFTIWFKKGRKLQQFLSKP